MKFSIMKKNYYYNSTFNFRQAHVEALGYIGFGISPNGGMTGSDVVIGWVNDDGNAVFHVCSKSLDFSEFVV